MLIDKNSTKIVLIYHQLNFAELEKKISRIRLLLNRLPKFCAVTSVIGHTKSTLQILTLTLIPVLVHIQNLMVTGPN